MLTIEDWHRPQATEAVGLLCAAFRDYPVMRFILRDAGAAYERHLPRLIAGFCEGRLARGVPLIGLRDGGAALGVAVVSPAQEGPAPPALDRFWEELEELLGAGALARLEAYSEACEASDPGLEGHYLGMVGVRPDRQGEGHGRRLVEAALERARQDPASPGLLLNTELESNVPFYRGLGFELVGRASVDRPEGGDLHTWCFYRRV